MKGDTLFSIAAYLDLGACDIAAANNIKDPNTIVVGTLLKVPAATERKDHESCTSQPSPQQREEAIAHPYS
jgi:LysM repeat protein